MFLRVRGIFEKVILEGVKTTSILVKIAWNTQVVIIGDTDSDIVKGLTLGQEVDLICKMKAKVKKTEFTTYYNNQIYIVNPYPNVETEDEIKEAI